MKKVIGWVITLLSSLIALSLPVWADPGEMGFWGGIVDGDRLPKATEIILADPNDDQVDSTNIYKEVVFLSGIPVEFEGQMERQRSGDVTDALFGTYNETYTIGPTAATADGISIDREVQFDVNWIRKPELNQIIFNYVVTDWVEEIDVDGQVYELDPDLSTHDITVLQDVTAGVEYYSGSQSMRAVYLLEEQPTVLEQYGNHYRYECAWSKSEVHGVSARIIHGDGWQMSYEVRPNVSAFKTLIYNSNDPQLISFPGNLQEVYQVESGLAYDIYDMPSYNYDVETHGTANIQTINSFESLYAVDTSYLEGHPAHEDIRRLYALGILDGSPNMFQPAQAMTRSQFVVSLARALKLPLEPIPQANAVRQQDVNIQVFSDVTKDRPDYQHIMAAYNAGVVVGKSGSTFRPDDLITLEEAIQTIINSMGLLNLGIEPTNMTQFTDDADISDWAKKAVYAAARINLIGPDANGALSPKTEISKAVGAALVNRMIEYMRTELKTDYSEHQVHFAG